MEEKKESFLLTSCCLEGEIKSESEMKSGRGMKSGVEWKLRVKWTQQWNGSWRKPMGRGKRMEDPSSPPVAQKVKWKVNEREMKSEVDSTMEWKLMGRRKRMEHPSSPPDVQKVKCKVKKKWTPQWNGNGWKLMGSRKRMEAPASPPVAPLGEVAGQQSNHMLHWDRPLLPDTTQPQLTTEGDEDGIFFCRKC